MTSSAIARLREFQRQFTCTLRVPLDGSSGSLQATPDRYDSELCAAVRVARGSSAAGRLGVYNRQYWFRLFGALQNEFRLATALLGAWFFNELASRYLLAHPPRGHDLATIADGFAAFVANDVSDAGVAVAEPAATIPKRAFLEAIRIDLAHRGVTTASAVSPLSELRAERLEAARLVPSPTVVLVEENWPLVALRRDLPPDVSRPVRLGAPLPSPQTWAIARTAAGFRLVRLEPLQANLLRQLCTTAIADALASVEAECSPEDAEVLIANTAAWLIQSVELGMWSAIVEDSP